jgi:amino acid transporter
MSRKIIKLTHRILILIGKKINNTDIMAELKRHLGMWGAASIGIGAIIGAGIFVLSGVASGFAGPAVILSFLIAGLDAVL